MSLKFNCPGCATTLQAPEFMVGRRMSCGVCQCVFVVPEPPDAPPQDPASTSTEPEPPLFAAGSPYASDPDYEPRREPRYEEPEYEPRRPRRRRRPPPPPRGRGVAFWLITIFSVLILGACACCGGGYLLLPGEKWHRYQSAEGGFAVDLPAPVKKDMPLPDVKLEPGEHVEGAILWKRAEFYAIMYKSILPRGQRLESDEDILDAAVKEMQADREVRVLRTEKITVSGFPAREVEFTADDDGNYVARVIIANTRFYVVIGGGRFVKPGNPNIRRFLNSFEVTDRGMQNPPPWKLR